MSKKGLSSRVDRKGREASVNDSGQRGEALQPPLFYRCRCPECGEDALKLNGFGVFFRSKFLGVTNDGEFGCGDLELDGDYHWLIECGSCCYRDFDTDMLPTDSILEWAVAHGKALKTLEFRCPVCGSQYLQRIEKAIRSVRAVYEIAENSETKAHAEVTLSFERVAPAGKWVRYCCSNRHELAKHDGSPVQTPEDLVEWLKGRQSVDQE
jgi:hypothetical protein